MVTRENISIMFHDQRGATIIAQRTESGNNFNPIGKCSIEYLYKYFSDIRFNPFIKYGA